MSVTEIERATVVDDFVASMKWSDDTPEDARSLVIGNIRGFWSWMHSDEMEGCQSSVDQAMDARFHKSATIRGIPVWVCADDFSQDPSTGQGWSPDHIWAMRRDDGTAFELTDDEQSHWGEIAAETIDPYDEELSMSEV